MRAPLKLTVVVPNEHWVLVANGVEETTRLPATDPKAGNILGTFNGSEVVSSI